MVELQLTPGAVVKARLGRCPVCDSPRHARVLELPRLPLTGIYADAPAEHFPAPDQALLLCAECGHGYLENVVDPVLLYRETYTHATGESSIARDVNDFLWSFLSSIIGARRFNCVLEVGCNDLYLMRRLRNVADFAVGLDPVWRGRENATPRPNLRLVGSFLSEFDCGRELETPPDLVMASHTVEHIEDPYRQLQRLVDGASADALFCIEVPCFDTQLKNLRFDQVFHQHIQYFSLASMQRMIARLGCGIVAHTVNHRYLGGTLLVAFEKRTAGKALAAPPPEAGDVAARIRAFKARYQALRRELAEFDGPVYGYGAAQTLPILAYHLGLRPKDFAAIIDDNPARVGKFYPDSSVPIVAAQNCRDIADAGIVITALDSARTIMARALELNPKAIFRPLCEI
jgi:hypothetical protein